MNWYITKLVFRIICGDGAHLAQFDEQLRLIAAFDETEAFSKARKLGQQEEDAFVNGKGQVVRWEFINISEVRLLNDLSDGAELYSRIDEKDNAHDYIRIVNKKAEKYICLPLHYQ